jgi:hypothetical protein
MARKNGPKGWEKVEQVIRDRRMARPRGWDRVALSQFFTDGGRVRWATLPVYGAADLSPEGRARGNVRGWVIPAECFGRTVDQSQVNSVRAYIRDVTLAAAQVAGVTVPTIDAVATVLEHRDGAPVAVIYRRA